MSGAVQTMQSSLARLLTGLAVEFGENGRGVPEAYFGELTVQHMTSFGRELLHLWAASGGQMTLRLCPVRGVYDSHLPQRRFASVQHALAWAADQLAHTASAQLRAEAMEDLQRPLSALTPPQRRARLRLAHERRLTAKAGQPRPAAAFV